jgi:membrane protease YdiL (CAAX protease family)
MYYFQIVKINLPKVSFAISVFSLIIIGYFLAVFVSSNKETAWIYVLAYYAIWIIASFAVFTSLEDIRQMFKASQSSRWNLLPLIFIIPTIFFLFLPNTNLFKLDRWLLINLAICLTGPFLEEIYWRGLFTKIYGTTTFSFFFSSILFALSHPLLFGINSKGDSGLVAFAGTFLVGSIWWLCYYKTKSLRGCTLTHFLMDLFGMAVYVLANKAVLLPL